jgi:hypothetical protein
MNERWWLCVWAGDEVKGPAVVGLSKLGMKAEVRYDKHPAPVLVQTCRPTAPPHAGTTAHEPNLNLSCAEPQVPA